MQNLYSIRDYISSAPSSNKRAQSFRGLPLTSELGFPTFSSLLCVALFLFGRLGVWPLSVLFTARFRTILLQLQLGSSSKHFDVGHVNSQTADRNTGIPLGWT